VVLIHPFRATFANAGPADGDREKSGGFRHPAIRPWFAEFFRLRDSTMEALSYRQRMKTDHKHGTSGARARQKSGQQPGGTALGELGTAVGAQVDDIGGVSSEVQIPERRYQARRGVPASSP
jgi:hypothetical protein